MKRSRKILMVCHCLLNANTIFFMVTGDYPFGKFIEISKDVRGKLKPDTVMISNIGSFEYQEGKRLKEAGYTGIYH